MFSIKAIAVLALPLLAVANPLSARTGSFQCNTGNVNCCDQTSQSGGALGLVGLDCTSLPILGDLSSCTQQTVCCTGNSFTGLIAIGCTPVNLNL